MPVADPRGPNSRGKRLAPEQVRAIAESIARGEHHKEIAERFGISVVTVGAIKSGKRGASAVDDDLRARMQAASSATALDASRAQQVMAALEAGRSGRAIAEEFGISPSMVSAIKNGRAWAALDPDLSVRLGDRPRQGKALSATQAAEIKRRLLEGESSRKVAARFGVSASTVLAISNSRTWAEVAPTTGPLPDSR